MPHAVWSAVAVFRQSACRMRFGARWRCFVSGRSGANFGQEYAHVIRANHKAPRPCSRESPVAMMSRSGVGQERNVEHGPCRSAFRPRAGPSAPPPGSESLSVGR